MNIEILEALLKVLIKTTDPSLIITALYNELLNPDVYELTSLLDSAGKVCKKLEKE